MTVYNMTYPNSTSLIKELIYEDLPAANNAWFTAITISGSTTACWYVNLEVTVSIAGKLKLTRTKDSKTWTELLYSGDDLVAGASYRFGIEVSGGETLSVSYNATTGKINKFRLVELT